MTKKQSNIKKIKKAIKPAKVTLASKKVKQKNVSKNIKNKSSFTSKGKNPKLSQKDVKKKIITKKTIKIVKKPILDKATKSGSLKVGKRVKTENSANKIIAKKTVLKTIHPAKGKAKPIITIKAKKEFVKKIKQPKEPNNPIVTKPSKAVKEDKLIKIGKPAKAEIFDVNAKLIKPPKKSKGGRKPKNKNDDDDEPIVENDILIEQLINSTKRLKKPSKAPKQLRTFTNPMASLTVAKLVDTNKKGTSHPKKEPKGKFELEFVMHTSAGILYEFLTSPSGLAEWFADDVNIHDGVFSFFWEGSEQKAKLLSFKEDKFVRLQWLDKPDGTYFEFRIEKDDITGDISLIITDFADEAADLKTSKLLWDSQVNQLLHVIGSY